jgi:hypothetical protein
MDESKAAGMSHHLYLGKDKAVLLSSDDNLNPSGRQDLLVG